VGRWSTTTEIHLANHLNCRYFYVKLVQIGATRRSAGILCDGIDIFAVPPLEILQRMQRDAGEAFEYMGSVVFLKLGITLTGLHEEDLGDKAMTMFKPGLWDDHRAYFKSIDFRT
jgi:hypothetical protein